MILQFFVKLLHSIVGCAICRRVKSSGRSTTTASTDPARRCDLAGGRAARGRRAGGATRSSTRSTSAASRTRTATGPATSPACWRACRTCATSASTPSGSTPGTRRRWPTRGYDVADYRSIDPSFGTLEEAEQLIAEARALGIRTIVDIVPNHVSDQHAWFRRRSPSAPGSPERERFWFRPGRGADGELPPNGWQSIFGGPGWTRVKDANGAPGRVVPAPVRPRAARPQLDAPRRVARARGHPPVLVRPRRGRRPDRLGRPAREGPRARRGAVRQRARRAPVHRPRRAARDLPRAGARSPTAIPSRACSSARSGCPTPSGFARYLRPGRAAHRVQLRLPGVPVGARPDARVDRRRRSRRTRRSTPRRPGCSRTTTSRGRSRATAAPTRRSRSSRSGRARRPTCALGTRRARAAALLAMALPGSMYVYQGEELGLPEVEDIPPERRQDPMWPPLRRGRSGSRRLPGPAAVGRRASRRTASAPTGADRPWLDQPGDWARLTVAAQSAVPTSMLALYRAGLRLRRSDAVDGRRDPPLAPAPATTSSPSPAATASPASSTSARSRFRCRPAPASSSPATSSKEVRFRRTPRSGSARRRVRLRPGTRRPDRITAMASKTRSRRESQTGAHERE